MASAAPAFVNNRVGMDCPVEARATMDPNGSPESPKPAAATAAF
ncbi:hypothetical protein [Sphingorhabdus sp.]